MSRVNRLYKMPHRRRREKKTNYRRRLGLVKSGKVRVVIRKSSDGMRVQFVEFNTHGDKTLVFSFSGTLKKFGWVDGAGNTSAAYLTGLLAGVKAKEAGIQEAVLDIGIQISTKGSRIYAALKGVVDAGISVPHSGEILPSEERVEGKHIKGLKSNFTEVKNKIVGG